MSIAASATENFIPKKDFLVAFDDAIYDGLEDSVPKKTKNIMMDFASRLWDVSGGNIVAPTSVEEIENKAFRLSWPNHIESCNMSVIFYVGSEEIDVGYISLFSEPKSNLTTVHYKDIDFIKNISIETSIAWKKNVDISDRISFINHLKSTYDLGNMKPFKSLLDKQIDSNFKKLCAFEDDPKSLDSMGKKNGQRKLENIPTLKFYGETINKSMNYICETISSETGNPVSKKNRAIIHDYVEKCSKAAFRFNLLRHSKVSA